jgi:hypothetical protein
VLVGAIMLSAHFRGQKEPLSNEPPSVAVEKRNGDVPADTLINEYGLTHMATHGIFATKEEEPMSKTQPTPVQRREVRRARTGELGVARKEKLLNPPEAQEGAETASVPGVEGTAGATSAAQEASATVAGSERHVETAAADRKMLRIEFQTSDPNVRIIWLSPQASDRASSNKANERR